MFSDNTPHPVQPPLDNSRVRNQVGRFLGTFTMGAFYRVPARPRPCDPHGEFAVRYPIISSKLSLAFEGCGVVTPVPSSPVLSSGRATVGGTSHILGNHKKRGIVEIRYQKSRQTLIVALLAKVRCRGLTPRLKDTATSDGALQYGVCEVAA